MALQIRLSHVLILVCLLTWFGGSDAAVPPMALSDLVAASEAVVYGRVTSLDSHWDDSHRAIYTTVVIQPIEYMKGDLGPDAMKIEMPGGVVGDMRLVVSDMPEFELEEEVVLFLRSEYIRVVGMFQGKFSVREGIVVGEAMTVKDFGRHIAELSGAVQEGTEEQSRGETVIHGVRFTLEPPSGTRDRWERAPEPTRVEASTAGPVTLMTEDFEGTWPSGDWDLIDQAGTGHLWGKEDYKYHGGSYSMWEASAGANAVDPEFENYPHNMGTWARYGPFDLSDATGAAFRFWMSVNTAGENDYMYWAASGDGINFSGSLVFNGIGIWNEQVFDLADHLGDATVWIAFRFVSDASVNDSGVFVDDIELAKTIVSSTPPVVDDITPGTGPSGAAFSVTITGSYFGTSQGTSEARFTKDPVGGTYVYADVVTGWSDTAVVCEVPEGASSGPVNVIVDGNAGGGHDFLVTYAASSTWWQGAEPMPENLLINPNTNDLTDELPAVIRAIQEWNAAGGAAFSFAYGGPSSATGYGLNGLNEICWGSTGGAVAATYTWILGNSIYENDLVFDDLWSWSTDTPPPFLHFDVQAVATHEFGHWLRLIDLYGTADQGKTMYGRVSFSEYVQRTLETEDQGGIQNMYGPETVNITSRLLPSGEVGTPYSEMLVAVGGQIPYDWTLRLLSLPPGLNISSAGVINGIPTTAGTFYFNVRVTDDNSDKDSQAFYLTVSEDVTGPDVVVLTPNSGDSLEANAGYDITWTATDPIGVDSVSIYYSGDGGGLYELIASGEPNDGIYPWTVPATPTDSVMVKIIAYDVSLNVGQDESDSLSAIYESIVDVPEPRSHLPKSLVLWQNTPNPFSPGTNISFYLPQDEIVSLEVFDATGRLVDTIIPGRTYPAGVHTIAWSGRGREGAPLGSGVYFYRLKAGDFIQSKKMVMAR